MGRPSRACILCHDSCVQTEPPYEVWTWRYPLDEVTEVHTCRFICRSCAVEIAARTLATAPIMPGQHIRVPAR